LSFPTSTIVPTTSHIVTSGIVILDRIVASISVAVQRLRIGRAGDNRIGTDEAVKITVVIPCIVEIQPNGTVVALAGVLVARRRGAGGVARAKVEP
jgi:hypothetical protein